MCSAERKLTGGFHPLPGWDDRHVELRNADLDKENAGAPFSANHKVSDMAASAKRKFVLRFGGDKFASDMHVVGPHADPRPGAVQTDIFVERNERKPGTDPYDVEPKPCLISFETFVFRAFFTDRQCV